MGAVKNNANAVEDLMKERAKALIDRLGYADAARFIAIMGGEGNSVKDIRGRLTIGFDTNFIPPFSI